MAAASPATVADPPPKPPPVKAHLEMLLQSSSPEIQSSSAQVTDLGQTSRSSSPATGLSPTTGNFVLKPSSIVSKPRLEESLDQSLSTMAAFDKKLDQSFKSSSPAAGGHPTSIGITKQPASLSKKPSFAEVAKNGSLNNKRKSGPLMHMFGQPPPLPGTNIINKDGVDILVFEDEATDLLAANLKWALVGKFSQNLPNAQTVGKFLVNLNLRGEFELKWLSHRQILIVLSEEEDYALIWDQGFWVIDGCPMRTLKWTPTFNARIECPFAPVWVSLPGLPVHLFEKRALHLIASQLGRPLMVDTPTATRTRAAFARICVEINLLCPLKDVVNLNINGHLMQQPIVYENVPRYCAHCCHVGHADDQCFVKNEELKAEHYKLQEGKKKRRIKGKDKMEWVEKPNPNLPLCPSGKQQQSQQNPLGAENSVPNIHAVLQANNQLTVHPLQHTVQFHAEKIEVRVDVHDGVEQGDATHSSKIHSFDGLQAVEEGEITGECVHAVVHDDVAMHDDDGRGHANVLDDVAVLHVQSGTNPVISEEPDNGDLKVNVVVHEVLPVSAASESSFTEPSVVNILNGVLGVSNVVTEDDFCHLSGSAHGERAVQAVYSGKEMATVHGPFGKSTNVADIDDVSLLDATEDCQGMNEDMQFSGNDALHAIVDGDVFIQAPDAQTLNFSLHATVEDDVTMMFSELHSLSNTAQVDGLSSSGPSFADVGHDDQRSMVLHSRSFGVEGSSNSGNIEQDGKLMVVNSGIKDLHATVADLNSGIDTLHATVVDEVTMQSPESKTLIASVDDDVIMEISGAHSLNILAKVDGPSPAGPLFLPMKPNSQFDPAKVTNGTADVRADVTMHSGAQLINFNVEVGPAAVGPSGDDSSQPTLHIKGGSGHDLNDMANDVCAQEEYLADVAGLFAQSEDNSYDTSMVSSSKMLNNNSKILGPNLTEFTHIPTPGPTTTQILDLMISDIKKNNPNFDPKIVECKLADMFPEPLQTIYPEDEYSDEDDKLRGWYNQESPRSDDEESSEIDNFDDFDEYFEERIFPRVCSELNLECNAGYGDVACNSGYGGRVTRSMTRNGRAKV